MRPSDERRHLDAGPRPGEGFEGVGQVDVVAVCGDDAAPVLQRARRVLGIVIDHQDGKWPTTGEWRSLLPGWFVEACAEERSREEAEAWLAWWKALPADQQAAVLRERRWSLANWLFFLEPDERQWFWWSATVEAPDRLRVTVEVAGWPAPLGALEWLLRAAGALDVAVDEPASDPQGR